MPVACFSFSSTYVELLVLADHAAGEYLSGEPRVVAVARHALEVVDEVGLEMGQTRRVPVGGDRRRVQGDGLDGLEVPAVGSLLGSWPKVSSVVAPIKSRIIRGHPPPPICQSVWGNTYLG